MEVPIYCKIHLDFFANKQGICNCLINRNLDVQDCPFYKNKLDYERQQKII